MKTPVARKIWSELGTPVTMQQKMTYLAACQEWFNSGTSTHSVGASRVHRVTLPSAASVEVPNWFHVDDERLVVVGSTYYTHCQRCSTRLLASEASTVPSCPFARMVSLRCAGCA